MNPTSKTESAGDADRDNPSDEIAGDQLIVDDPDAGGKQASIDPVLDEGPGWLPAIMAGTVLMGIFGFIFCGVSTWYLWSQRTVIATRTIRDSYLIELEQSQLDVETKQAVMGEVETLADDLAGGRYDDWQSAAILQRLQRLPVLQWGQLQAVRNRYVERYLNLDLDSDRSKLEAIDRNIARLFAAVDRKKITSLDFQRILEPAVEVRPNDPSMVALKDDLSQRICEGVFDRIEIMVDEFKIGDENLPPVDVKRLVTEAINDGATKGAY